MQFFIIWQRAYNHLLSFLGRSSVMPVLPLLLMASRHWPLGALPDWLLCPFSTHSLFREHSLPFWHHRILQAYLLLSLSQPRNKPLFQRALVLFIRERPFCFLRAPQPWVFTPQAMGPWMPDFHMCPNWPHPLSKEGQWFPLVYHPQIIPLTQTCSLWVKLL